MTSIKVSEKTHGRANVSVHDSKCGRLILDQHTAKCVDPFTEINGMGGFIQRENIGSLCCKELLK